MLLPLIFVTYVLIHCDENFDGVNAHVYENDRRNDRYDYGHGDGDANYFRFENGSVVSTQHDRGGRMGVYNVETGDEFYLHHFDIGSNFAEQNQDDGNVFKFNYFNYSTRPVGHKQVTKPQSNKQPNGNTTTTTTATKNKPKNSRNKIKNGAASPNKNCAQTHPNRNKVAHKKPNHQPRPTKAASPVAQNKNKRPTTPPQPTRHKNTNRTRTQNNCGRGKKCTNRTENTQHKQPNQPGNKITDVLRKYLNALQEKIYGTRRQKSVGEERAAFFGFPLSHLRSKFLSLFTVVQFSNFRCVSEGAFGTYEGACHLWKQCVKMGGKATGKCADGYGVCCVFRGTCGGSSNQNCTYFESPGYPGYFPPNTTVATEAPAEEESFDQTTGDTTDESTEELITMTPDSSDKYQEYFLSRQLDLADSLACIYRVFKTSNDIQQMRIDFIDLELQGPMDGDCTRERLVVIGRNLNDVVPVICGYNTGQHVYVDVSTLEGPLQISVLSNAISAKRFKIRVCQLAAPCGNSMNCLQYYTGTQGVISSFNYEKAAMTSRSDPQYLNNANYAICVRREAGYCSISYTNVDSTNLNYPFGLENVDSDGVSTVGEGAEGTGLGECPGDYIVIEGARLCGQNVMAPITDSSRGPIVIPVKTDDSVAGRGFKLFYTQNRC